ncbi:MAG: hypothetical protein D3917_09025 [Candidatus Electrothrix sp. AX5]|nr:hypothetical protein [Candidatus Electrothrix sp. AX5]
MANTHYASIIKSIKSPLGIFALISLACESVLMASVWNVPAAHQISIVICMVVLLILIIIGTVKLTLKAMESKTNHASNDNENIDNIIKPEEISFPNITTVISHVSNTISKEHKEHSSLKIQNFGLDLALTLPWAMNNFLSDQGVENIIYNALVIDGSSDIINEYVGAGGHINPDIKATLSKLNGFVDRDCNKLNARNVKIEIRAYHLPPVIHGFLVNDDNLYFSLTDIHNNRVDIVALPYLYLQKNSERNNRLFRVYQSWFDYTWKKSRMIFKFSDTEKHYEPL